MNGPRARHAVILFALLIIQGTVQGLLPGRPHAFALPPPKSDPFKPRPRPVKPRGEEPQPGGSNEARAVPPDRDGCHLTPQGTTLCQETLADYVEGEFTNPRIKSFSEQVAERIYYYENTRGRESVREITVQGVADGLKNSGGKDWSEIPAPCRGGNTGPLFDPGLAYVRGCLVKEKINETLRDKYRITHLRLSDDNWIDIEDGKAVGPKIRRAVVRFRIADTRR